MSFKRLIGSVPPPEQPPAQPPEQAPGESPEWDPEEPPEAPLSNCLFCQIARGEKNRGIVAKFKHCYAIMDNFPVSNGHILIIPYEHMENWFSASEEVRIDIMNAMHYMKAKLDAEYKPDGYNFGANCSESAGQTIMHLHLHLIPRYKGDMDDPKGGVRGVIPSKQKYSAT